MKLTLAEPKYMKDGISIISEIVTEATFKVTKNSFKLVAMDPANVAMVIFQIPANAFVSYDIDKDENLTLNLNNLKQVFRRIKGNDTLTLEMEESKLKITLQSTSKRTFFLPLIELNEGEQKIPELSFNAVIETQSSILNDAIDDVDVVGESVNFMTTEMIFGISSKGDLSKAEVEIPADNVTSISSTSEGIKAKYSIEYLKKLIQGSKLSEKVKIKFSKDYPLKLEYVTKDKVELSFILAPRVDND
ncbi:MAG: proliferating cell nuclear antigen (pcna) [Candidatus Nanoarchaeia archaeon]|jgi:proliferating cell nuclear antigen|nr:proliferating cell nuclear antigen (pcna) [Candidatus Nanoarchaeia archaeon]